HIFAFTLPTQLGFSQTAAILREDNLLRGIFLTPFSRAFFLRNTIDAAHLSYFVLLGLTLLSFALNFRGYRAWRGLLVLFFLALSAWNVRAVPFFAIVAAPIVALNIQEFARRRAASVKGHDPLPQLGRAFAYIVVFVLLVTAWPGWLHAQSTQR